MKIIISPSKTMKSQSQLFSMTKPLFPAKTCHLRDHIHKYTIEDLCSLMKISYRQATQVHQHYHNPTPSQPALCAYQGTVFKQLDIEKYNAHHDYLDNHLRIISAYYGILKYNTAISHYRLDMTMKPQNINLYDYWYTPIYQHFEEDDLVISLASREFTALLAHPRLYFIDFIELHDHKPKRQAMIIKKARGQMLNHMILHEIKTMDDLKNITIDGFVYHPEYDQKNSLAFVRIKD